MENEKGMEHEPETGLRGRVLGSSALQVLWVSGRNKALCNGFEISGISA